MLLLAALAATVGLGPVGWLAGTGYGLVGCVVLGRGLLRRGTGGLGPADRVTLARSVLIGGVTALTVDALTVPVWFPGPSGSRELAEFAGLVAGSGPAAPVAGRAAIVVLGAVALALDAVDGWVARRTGTASALGARFDMEADAFLIAVLSCGLAPVVGGWVLATGGMRYAFVAAGRVLPWMCGVLPPRYWRKAVAAVQGIVLVAATSGVLPSWAAVTALAAALALLVESFGRDVWWLWRHRVTRAGTTGRAGARPVVPRPGRVRAGAGA